MACAVGGEDFGEWIVYSEVVGVGFGWITVFDAG